MWTLRYEDRVVQHDIPALDSATRTRIKKTIESKLLIDPITFGKPLRFSLSGQRSLRIGDWRVLYTIDAERKLVFITAIGHRKNIYEA